MAAQSKLSSQRMYVHNSLARRTTIMCIPSVTISTSIAEVSIKADVQAQCVRPAPDAIFNRLPSPLLPIPKPARVSPPSSMAAAPCSSVVRKANHFGTRFAEVLRVNRFPDVLRFSPEGDAVYILNRKEMCERVLPGMGMRPSWSSFTRQLNNYGFTYAAQRRSIKFVDVYVHASFRRDGNTVPLFQNAREPNQKVARERLQRTSAKAPGMRHATLS